MFTLLNTLPSMLVVFIFVNRFRQETVVNMSKFWYVCHVCTPYVYEYERFSSLFINFYIEDKSHSDKEIFATTSNKNFIKIWLELYSVNGPVLDCILFISFLFVTTFQLIFSTKQFTDFSYWWICKSDSNLRHVGCNTSPVSKWNHP